MYAGFSLQCFHTGAETVAESRYEFQNNNDNFTQRNVHMLYYKSPFLIQQMTPKFPNIVLNAVYTNSHGRRVHWKPSDHRVRKPT